MTVQRLLISLLVAAIIFFLLSLVNFSFGVINVAHRPKIVRVQEPVNQLGSTMTATPLLRPIAKVMRAGTV